jgi:hypothetical protein
MNYLTSSSNQSLQDGVVIFVADMSRWLSFSHSSPLPAVAVSFDADVMDSENKWIVSLLLLYNISLSARQIILCILAPSIRVEIHIL